MLFDGFDPACEECGDFRVSIVRILREAVNMPKTEAYSVVYILCQKCDLPPSLWSSWPQPNINLVIPERN